NGGGELSSAIAADLDGDGRPDLGFAGGSVGVRLNAGLCFVNCDTFAAPVNGSVGANPDAVASADFNRDAKADLAVVNAGSNNVSVLLQNGSGTFAAAVNYGVGTDPRAIVVGDFNRDGRPDLAIANHGMNNVSTLLGNADGTFAAAVNYAAGTAPNGIATADVNRDGKLDLAVTGARGAILLGNG